MLLAAFHALLDANGSGSFQSSSVSGILVLFIWFSASGAGRLDVSDVCLSTASFLVQSCGIQLAVFMLKSASHILFQFFDSSSRQIFDRKLRPPCSPSYLQPIHTLLRLYSQRTCPRFPCAYARGFNPQLLNRIPFSRIPFTGLSIWTLPLPSLVATAQRRRSMLAQQCTFSVPESHSLTFPCRFLA